MLGWRKTLHFTAAVRQQQLLTHPPAVSAGQHRWGPCLPAGLLECGEAGSEDGHMLRLLTPLAKLFTAKEAVAVASEGEARSGMHDSVEACP